MGKEPIVTIARHQEGIARRVTQVSDVASMEDIPAGPIAPIGDTSVTNIVDNQLSLIDGTDDVRSWVVRRGKSRRIDALDVVPGG